MPISQTELDSAIRSFAGAIEASELTLAYHKPPPEAEFANCISNALRYCESHGGQPVTGWYFQIRTSSKGGRCLIATHHTVWHDPKTMKLFDVTPFHPNSNCRPICQNGDPIFLVDRNATPNVNENKIMPLPSRFHPIDQTPAAIELTAELQREEFRSYNLEHGTSYRAED